MIPASGGLITAVNWSMSNMPRFETENVAPVYSLGCSRRLRARSASSLASRPISERLELRVPDHGGDEPVLYRHRHPHMHLVPVADVVVLEPGVADRMLGERVRRRLDDDVVERDFALIAELLVERLARLARPLHVHFGRQEEMRNGAERRREPLRDRLADLGERNVIVRSAAGGGMRDTGNGKRCCGRCGR